MARAHGPGERRMSAAVTATAAAHGPDVLVLGVGNSLLGDEGVGVEAALEVGRRLAAERRVRCIDGGTLSFTLAGEIEDARALIVTDAAELKAAPGAVRVFEGEQMDEFLRHRVKSSVHEVSLDDLLAIARLTGHLPSRRAFVGIQPGAIDWGCELTPAGRAAVAVAVEHACELVRRWLAPGGAATSRILAAASGD